VQGKPDALKPDDQHRLPHAQLDQDEHHEQDEAAGDPRDDPRVAPPRRAGPVGLNPVGDGDKQARQADTEGRITRPVHMNVSAGSPVVQRCVGPDRAEDPDRYADEEDGAPVDGGQEPTHDQTDEAARDRGNLIDPQSESTLVDGEGVRENRGRVREEHGAECASLKWPRLWGF